MKVTFLGTATSSGIPTIGCNCVTCASSDPKNRRTRSSIVIRNEQGNAILVDTAVEFREQAILNRIDRIDAVLFTHAHADHVHGLDDIRFFNMKQNMVIPCYGSEKTIECLRKMFYYIFEDGQVGGGKPQISLNIMKDPCELFGIKITPVPAYHGTLPILGFRLDNFVYLTDVSDLPSSSRKLLEGVEVLVLGALRKTPHPTHFSLSEALEVAASLHPRATYLTHLGHKLEHNEVSRELPDNVHLAYDGLNISL